VLHSTCSVGAPFEHFPFSLSFSQVRDRKRKPPPQEDEHEPKSLQFDHVGHGISAQLTTFDNSPTQSTPAIPPMHFRDSIMFQKSIKKKIIPENLEKSNTKTAAQKALGTLICLEMAERSEAKNAKRSFALNLKK